MRSSEQGPKSSLAPTIASVLAIGIAALVIGVVRFRIAEQFHRLKARNDVYALPSPEQTIVMSLGYRSALADLLFAHVLVSYGLHFEEKRRFEFVGNYLDTINALDPKFRRPYRYADTLLTLQPVAPPLESYFKAREILERGLRELPYDAELWSMTGQFIAYLAPAQFSNEKTKQEWRLAGARTLAHACELVGKNENLPYHCITAARLLSRAGQREAMIQFLERVLTVTDNPEIRNLALGYLEKTVGERERARVEARYRRLRALFDKDLPFVSKDLWLVLGPPFDAAACAGPGHANEPGCATTWQAWEKLVEGQGEQ